MFSAGKRRVSPPATRVEFFPHTARRKNPEPRTSASNSVPGITRSINGDVITVVSTAIITSMQKTLGGITPSSRPLLMTINSISARVFIMMPMMTDSRDEKPVNFAANAHPPNFPRMARNETAAAKSHMFRPWMEPMSVCRPV